MIIHCRLNRGKTQREKRQTPGKSPRGKGQITFITAAETFILFSSTAPFNNLHEMNDGNKFQDQYKMLTEPGRSVFPLEVTS